MTPAPHLFVSSVEGALWDTRAPDCFNGRPLRACYQTHAGELDTLAKVKATLRAGAYAWPGSYPLYFIARDGAALSFAAVRQHWRQIVADYLDGYDSAWPLSQCVVNWEDSDLTCSHTGERIESAHGDDDETESDLA